MDLKEPKFGLILMLKQKSWQQIALLFTNDWSNQTWIIWKTSQSTCKSILSENKDRKWTYRKLGRQGRRPGGEWLCTSWWDGLGRTNAGALQATVSFYNGRSTTETRAKNHRPIQSGPWMKKKRKLTRSSVIFPQEKVFISSSPKNLHIYHHCITQSIESMFTLNSYHHLIFWFFFCLIGLIGSKPNPQLGYRQCSKKRNQRCWR